MRDIRRRIATDRPRMALRRSADGRLKPADNEADIADIWADQKRIQLKDAIDEQKRKELRKQRRKERGFWGRSSAAAPPQVISPTAKGSKSSVKEIEIRLSMPKVHVPHPADVLGRLGDILAPLVRTRRRVFALVGVIVMLLGYVGLQAMGNAKKHDLAKNDTKTAVLSASQQPQTPDFETVLPIDKKIEDLGGWGRVSPPNSAPAFAYSDSLGGVHIVVTEQQLPDDFASDIPGHLAKAAKQFNASKKLTTTEGSDVYVSAAANGGAQSVVTSKNGLLILIRSTSLISDQIWSDYVYSLE